MVKLERGINDLNEYVGTYSAFLILPLILVVVYEVIMRYMFNAPTVWAFEATTLLYGVHYMMGLGYTHKQNGHVAIDIFESRLAQKPRATLRIITNLIVFVPTIGMLSVWSILYAVTSWQNWERASSSWAPPIYPFKTFMAIGFVLLFLQGIAKLISDIRSLGSPDEKQYQEESP